MAHALDYPLSDVFTGRARRTLAKRPPVGPRRVIVLASAALLVAAFVRVAHPVVEARMATTPETPAAAESLLPAELPREWRWQRKAATFDGMFRQKR